MSKRSQKSDTTPTPKYEPGTQVWLSICSGHIGRDEDCARCAAGAWYDADELNVDHALYQRDYVEWFKKHNDGKEPSEWWIENHPK